MPMRIVLYLELKRVYFMNDSEDSEDDGSDWGANGINNII